VARDNQRCHGDFISSGVTSMAQSMKGRQCSAAPLFVADDCSPENYRNPGKWRPRERFHLAE
jgi:hypothetical protein